MDEEVLTELLSIRKDFLEVVSSASESYTLKEKLEILVAISKTGDGRADLASKNHLYNQQVILISKCCIIYTSNLAVPSFGSINMNFHICMNIKNSSMKMKRGREKKDDLVHAAVLGRVATHAPAK
jgi:hypothetical protein